MGWLCFRKSLIYCCTMDWQTQSKLLKFNAERTEGTFNIIWKEERSGTGMKKNRKMSLPSIKWVKRSLFEASKSWCLIMNIVYIKIHIGYIRHWTNIWASIWFLNYKHELSGILLTTNYLRHLRYFASNAAAWYNE